MVNYLWGAARDVAEEAPRLLDARRGGTRVETHLPPPQEQQIEIRRGRRAGRQALPRPRRRVAGGVDGRADVNPSTRVEEPLRYLSYKGVGKELAGLLMLVNTAPLAETWCAREAGGDTSPGARRGECIEIE